RRRLWKRRRSRGVERDAALDFLLDLMDVAVEHGHRTEALQVTERAGSILSAPPPFLVNRPQGYMSKNDDRGARRTAGEVLLHPFELVVAELGTTGGFESGVELENVAKRDEMHTAMIKAVPASPFGILAVAVEVGLAAPGVVHTGRPGVHL